MDNTPTLTLDEGDIEMLLRGLIFLPSNFVGRDGGRWERLTGALEYLLDTHHANGVRVEMGRKL